MQSRTARGEGSTHLSSRNALADSLDHLRVVAARDAWPITRGTGTTVGVVDTGFYLDHPDLRNQFWVNDAEDLNDNGRLDDADRNGVDDDGNGFVDDVIGYDFVDRASPIQDGEYEMRDPDPSADPKGGGSGHGTAVAGVAAAAAADPEAGANGVAPGAKIVALRAFGGDGFGQSDDIAAAIAYGATMELDVLNLSFGRNRSVPVIEAAIEYANEQGTVVVASAGNELTDDPHYPSDYPEVLSVVWLAEDGEGLPDFNRSQFGIGVDIGAPGSNVYTTNFPSDLVGSDTELGRSDLYRSYDGSSFSAPQVAGAAALLRAADSSLSPASIRSTLTKTARDLEEENWDHTTGAGLLNVSAALTRAYPARTQIQRPAHNQGFHERSTIPVVGTAVDPSFRAYAVYYAQGTRDLDERRDPWVELRAPTSTQALRDTLARWDLSSLEPGEYTLRLVTTLKDGRTLEDRRRVIIDRSAPELSVEFLGVGRVEGANGVVGDLVTDDRSRLTTTIRLGSRERILESEEVARRHGLAWPDPNGTGGTATVEVTATNASGLRTTLDTTLRLPENRENTALLRRTRTSVPRGQLLPAAPDFDGDSLREIVLNQSATGGLTDTLRAFEWDGDGFVLADSLRARLFPRDLGDTDQNGRQELLLQVRGGTLLFEQPSSSAFPDSLVYADTLGPDTPLDEVANGARLSDLDADGRGEVLATSSRRIIGVERRSSGFERVFELSNPTSTAGRDSSLANFFDTPQLMTGDFDGDGRRDLLAGDRDGDLVVYESVRDDEMSVAWTHETDRVDAGNRFAAGDLVSGGGLEFATMTTYFSGTLDNGESVPPISFYSVWTCEGDDAYRRAFRLPVAGPYSASGSMTTADFDGDGVDELAISHAPALLVVDRTGSGQWRVLHENRNGAPLQSRSLVSADFDADGTPSLLAETTDDRLVRFVVDGQARAVSPPTWVQARPTGPSSGQLEWRSPGADSVTIFEGSPTGELNRLATNTDSNFTTARADERRYALRAWRGGARSPLSPTRTVRPHPPASLSDVSYPSPTTTRLRFTEPLRSGLRAEQFRFGDRGMTPQRIVQARGGTTLALHFDNTVRGQSGFLRWSDLVDTDGLAVRDTSAALSFPAGDQRSLYIQQAEILAPSRVRLSFNEPLRPALVSDLSRYEVRPRGQVTAARQDADAPSVVTVELSGVVVGANGQESSLSVTDMQSTRGHRLSKEGGTVRLTQPADDLANVYVYPNPYRRSRHESLTVAGLPRTATVRVYTPDGRLVRVLSVEDNRNGGAEWDLHDRRGDRVPSGIYLFRVSAPDQSPVLEKAAVVQ